MSPTTNEIRAHLPAVVPNMRMPGIFSILFGGVAQQGVFVFGHCFDARRLQIVNGCTQSGGINEVRRAGLELEGQFSPRSTAEAHMANHFASALIGGHFLQQVAFAIKYSHSAWAVHLVR